MTLKIDAHAKELCAQGLDVVGFGAGEPDFITPKYIRDAAVAAIEEGHTKYTPASGIPALKQAACDRYQRKYGLSYTTANAVFSGGAKHSLFNTMQTLLNPGDEVLIIAPFWLSYSELVKMADGVPVIVHAAEENGFCPAIADLEAAITQRTKAIIVNSPSNPTGAVYGFGLLKQIADLAQRHDLYIISDDIYDELVYGVEQHCIAQVNEDAKKRTIVINGVSKAYAMTGWRIGYALCDEAIAKVMTAYQSNATSNPCSISQYASVAALEGGTQEIAQMRQAFERRRDLICDLIDGIPMLSCNRPGGAFYTFVNITRTVGRKFQGKEIKDAISFAEILLSEKLVAVVPGTPFGAEGYIRLSYACAEENIKKGLARIAAFCEQLS